MRRILVRLLVLPASGCSMRFSGLSFRAKMVILGTFGSLVPLVLVMTGISVFDYYNLREATYRNLAVQAEIVSEHWRQDLLDNPDKAVVLAYRALAAFHAEEDLIAACIYDETGKVLASHFNIALFPEKAILVWPRQPTHPMHSFRNSEMLLYRHIGDGEEKIGGMFLRYDLGRMHAHLRFQLIFLGSVTGFGLFIALLISLRIQRTLVRPIYALAETARYVSDEKDFDARADKFNDDELGELTDSFNTMLEQIQSRDKALQEGRDSLEARVEERTRDLSKAKEKALIAAESLAQSEGLTRAIFNAAADGIITVDERGIIEDFNVAAERIFDKSAVDCIGQSIGILVPPRRRAEYCNMISDYLRSDAKTLMIADAELECIRRDLSTFPCQLSVSSFRIADRRMFTGIVRDITEAKQAAAEKERLSARLVEASRYAGMAEIATGVLHNVGNVLNSVNISSAIVTERVKDSKGSGLSRVVQLMETQIDDIGRFMTHDERGKQLLPFLRKLATHLSDEREGILEELESLTKNVDHIKQIVIAQQAYAKSSGVKEAFNLQELMEDALNLSLVTLLAEGITVERNYEDLTNIVNDRHKILQIIVNLIYNAKDAMACVDVHVRRLSLSVQRRDNVVQLEVRDTGVGIPTEDLARIFTHGFTTKDKGHGFGLHSCGNAATELGGTLRAKSEGPGRGATFILEIPFEERPRPI